MNNPLFDASYRRLFGGDVAAGQSDPFFAAFYRRFLADPDIAAMFRDTDMDRQVVMLRKSFFHLAGFYVTNAPSGELERVAQIHTRLGITSAHYDQWLDCLVATVAEFDPDCDHATELAWRWALTPGVTFMKLYDYFREGDRR
ncbi:MAG: globin domain-containing protein [Gammaproteobacteria bacterium]|nr:globin domain-containing protein [Gammaproteobacteria bacterium]